MRTFPLVGFTSMFFPLFLFFASLPSLLLTDVMTSYMVHEFMHLRPDALYPFHAYAQGYE